METVSALHVTHFTKSVEIGFNCVHFCSFWLTILMTDSKRETFVRSLGEGASEPKVRLKQRPGLPGLFLCQRCFSSNAEIRLFNPWYWVVAEACSMLALQTLPGANSNIHSAL
jgi:hypothetical protein